ncbi:putative phage tail protein [Pseudomonas sp. D47]|uniref:putative phage tail protein n=1 Tax=Pseudomonas sp. D47 TaxID=3159447 RepID=UPI00387AD135
MESSSATLVADAKASGFSRRLRLSSIETAALAEVVAVHWRGRQIEGAVNGVALLDATVYLARRVSLTVTATAEVAANHQVWLPLQPEKKVRYPRYSQADFQQQLMNLLPQGRAWPRDGEDAALMSAWADEMYRIEQRGWKLLEQWDPRTTDELFEDWERFFELPGTGTEEQRRQALIAAWLAGGTLSRPEIAGILDRLGIRATIEFVQPFRVGESAVGDALSTDWYSTWIVYVHNPHEVDLVWLQTYLRRLAPAGDYVHVVASPKP